MQKNALVILLAFTKNNYNFISKVLRPSKLNLKLQMFTQKSLYYNSYKKNPNPNPSGGLTHIASALAYPITEGTEYSRKPANIR